MAWHFRLHGGDEVMPCNMDFDYLTDIVIRSQHIADLNAFPAPAPLLQLLLLLAVFSQCRSMGCACEMFVHYSQTFYTYIDINLWYSNCAHPHKHITYSSITATTTYTHTHTHTSKPIHKFVNGNVLLRNTFFMPCVFHLERRNNNNNNN